MKTFPALKAGASVLAVAGLGLGLGACGSSTTKAAGVSLAPGGGPTTTAIVAAAPTPTATTPTPTATVATPTSGPLSKAPTIAKPSGKAPTSLVVKNLITGTGQTAQAGDTISVNYVGAVYSTGKVFQSSFSDGQGTFSFALDTGAVIKGWDEGVVGMKVGGRRQLIIPPSLAYGADKTSPLTKDTLIFDIDLLKVSK